MSVNQEKFFQVFEARYGEITRHDRLQMTKEVWTVRVVERNNDTFKAEDLSSDLHALLTGYPNADISRLDHVDIVRTVT